MQAAKVLIVDSDRAVVESLRAHLAQAGYRPLCAYGDRQALQIYVEDLPDALVMRDAAPGVSGVSLAWRIREMSDVPIVFISDRKERFALERALQVGDDYMPQPWSWERLVARLAVLLKRRPANAQRIFSCDEGRLKIDLARRQVTKAGQLVPLTGTEFKLLSYFVRRANRVLKYDELLAHVWGHTDPKARSQVSLYVRYLRRKLEDDPTHPAYFCTERGVGYSFRPKSVMMLSDSSERV